MIKKDVFFIAIILLFVFIGYFSQNHTQKKGLTEFNEFYSAEIDSEIESFGIKRKGAWFRLSDNREFVFYPYTDLQLNEGRVFNLLVEKGDSIIKPAFTDTVYVCNGGKVFKYTFYKFK